MIFRIEMHVLDTAPLPFSQEGSNAGVTLPGSTDLFLFFVLESKHSELFFLKLSFNPAKKQLLSHNKGMGGGVFTHYWQNRN